MVEKVRIWFSPGTFIRNAVMDAVRISARFECDVEFDFGGGEIKVIRDQEVKGLYRIEYNYAENGGWVEKVKVIEEKGCHQGETDSSQKVGDCEEAQPMRLISKQSLENQ